MSAVTAGAAHRGRACCRMPHNDVESIRRWVSPGCNERRPALRYLCCTPITGAHISGLCFDHRCRLVVFGIVIPQPSAQ